MFYFLLFIYIQHLYFIRHDRNIGTSPGKFNDVREWLDS